MKEVIVDNEYLTLWYHPESCILHHEVKQFCVDPVFKDMLDKGTELLKKHKATKWLADQRKGRVQTKEFDAWVHTNWLPRTIKAGWKHWAILMPQSTIGTMYIERISSQMTSLASLGLTAKVFTTPEEAMKWLQSV